MGAANGSVWSDRGLAKCQSAQAEECKLCMAKRIGHTVRMAMKGLSTVATLRNLAEAKVMVHVEACLDHCGAR